MSDSKKRRTVAEADKEIEALKAELAGVKASDQGKEIEELKKIIQDRDLMIERLMGKDIPTPAEDHMKSIKKASSSYKAGLYVAKAAPMYNGETKQMFTISKPIKVSEDQLKDSWFMLQVTSGNIVEYQG